jgi:nitrite reductase (NADH) large subunit
VHYVQRVGLDYVKQRVVADADNRKALQQRLLYALQGVVDPWQERTQGVARHEFEPLPVPKPVSEGGRHAQLA